MGLSVGDGGGVGAATGVEEGQDGDECEFNSNESSLIGAVMWLIEDLPDPSFQWDSGIGCLLFSFLWAASFSGSKLDLRSSYLSFLMT